MCEIVWKKNTVLKEWDAFCHPLVRNISRYDTGKEACAPADSFDICSKELDLFLQLSFAPTGGDILNSSDIFLETHPLLDKALLYRVSEASDILNQILDTQGHLEVSMSPSPKIALLDFFRKLLLPSYQCS